jgi:glycosyltransferase involved in cell wall biosynthesis
MIEYHTHSSPDESLKVLGSADVLFLPMSFNGALREATKTSAPGKLADYLASGTAILAFVPPDSFVHRYLEKWECGLVVTEYSKNTLAHAISRVTEDAELRALFGRNARQRARTDFDADLARINFIRATNVENREQGNHRRHINTF